jgi:hypothetical protein
MGFIFSYFFSALKLFLCIINKMKGITKNDDDEGATWSIDSNGGISRSSHDDGFLFQSKYIFYYSF